MAQKIKNRIGIRYSYLIVKEFIGMDWNGQGWVSLWKCLCDCGDEAIIKGGDLQTKHVRSCGCLKREVANKQRGENHSCYIDGRYYKIKKLKRKIRKRDNYICQDCSKTQEQSLKESNRILDVHHIDGDDTNNVEENMVTLCLGCHNKRQPRHLIKGN